MFKKNYLLAIIGFTVLSLFFHPNAHGFDCYHPHKIGYIKFLTKADVVFIGEETSSESKPVGDDLISITKKYKVIEPLKGVSSKTNEINIKWGGSLSGPVQFQEDNPNPLSYFKNKTDLGKDTYELVIAFYGKKEQSGERNLYTPSGRPCTVYAFSKHQIIALLKSSPYRYRYPISAALLFFLGAFYLLKNSESIKEKIKKIGAS